jgi:hypothetical protein
MMKAFDTYGKTSEREVNYLNQVRQQQRTTTLRQQYGAQGHGGQL